MSAIDVTQAVPQRLFYADDNWCLEVQRWQALARDLFNPIRSFIVGSAKVNAYMKEAKTSHSVVSPSPRHSRESRREWSFLLFQWSRMALGDRFC